MDDVIHRFKVGHLECLLVNDGTFTYHGADTLFFVDAPRDRLQPYLSKYRLGAEYVSTYPSLVITTGDHRVIVDTGAGDLAPTTGKLMANLQAAGVSPDDIDTVILTHGHPPNSHHSPPHSPARIGVLIPPMRARYL